MKLLKFALFACWLSAVSMAHAQTPAPAADNANSQQQGAQADTAPAAQRAVAAPKKAADCVGPASFCSVFFGGS
ncbi:hypothetical protein B0G84_3807 [Paraburkholderia sp. BL8N3]|jgi:hypothetical protein|nr:hypothetical protein [Paraburkholderia sp. BL8N3]TCK38496.1 hypothetical protein B0G84_3807 [Paraburkholderia sp. BL8N3]